MTETDRVRAGSRSTSRRAIVVLPAPEGDDRTSSSPRRRIGAALEQRLRARAQDSASDIAARMAKSAEEMSHWPEYDYVIVNDTVEASVAEARAIVTAERLRRTRQPGLADFVATLRRE